MSRPSASVFCTSTVIPPYCVSTSPGRCAVPDGMFSAIGTVAITSIGNRNWAASVTVAITAAAPPMSEVMWCIDAAGLIEIPPVSNVTPLPTSATFFACFGFLASFEPRWVSRTSRGGRDEPWPTPITPP